MNTTQVPQYVPLYFCSRPECDLHIDLSAGHGTGNWATLPGTRITVGRTRVDHRYYCDLCARSIVCGSAAPCSPASTED
jgi:hypothetical protein